MTDAEAFETLEAFVRQHAACGEREISTEFTGAQDSEHINVTRRCQKCDERAVATVTRVAAVILVRQTAQQDTLPPKKTKE